MSIKVIPNNAATTGEHDIKKSQLRGMVQGFRSSPVGGNDTHGRQREVTRFAHFPIERVVQMLVDNKIVSATDPVSTLLANRSHGIKVYFAQHVAKEDCPADVNGYIGRNTVVLVNTEKNTAGLWDDMLNEDPKEANFIETSGFKFLGDPGTGSDKTELCPPQCSLFGDSL